MSQATELKRAADSLPRLSSRRRNRDQSHSVPVNAGDLSGHLGAVGENGRERSRMTETC